MSKKILISMVAVLLVGGAAFAYTRRPSSPAPLAPADQTAGEIKDEATEFAEAFTSGRPTLCTLTKGTDTMEYKIKDKKMRGNIQTTVNGKATLSHMINDTEYLYMWSDDQKQGSKMSLNLPSPTGVPEQKKPALTSEADYTKYKNEGYTINCATSTVADDEFVPPKDVQFVDPSEMMKAVPSPAAGGTIDYKKLQEQYGSMVPQQ